MKYFKMGMKELTHEREALVQRAYVVLQYASSVDKVRKILTPRASEDTMNKPLQNFN